MGREWFEGHKVVGRPDSESVWWGGNNPLDWDPVG